MLSHRDRPSRRWSPIVAIAQNTFRELLRDRVLYVVGFYLLMMAVALRILPEISGGAYRKIFLDTSLAAMEILGLFVVAFVSTRSLETEIEKRTLLVLISKPISRGQLVLGKFFGLWGVLVAAIALMAVFTIPFALLGDIPLPLGGFSLALVFLALKLAVLIAVALLFGVFTQSLLAAFLTLGVYLMGSWSADVLRLNDVTGNGNEGFTPVTVVLYLVLPDLVRLDFKNDAIYGLSVFPSPGTLLLNALYGLAYTIVALALAVAIFQRRQF